MKKVTPIAFMTGLLHKKFTKCCTQDSSGGSGLVSSTKIPLFKLTILINFIQSTRKLQPMHQYHFIKEFLIYKCLSDLSELDF